jgi:hypothetical protein
LAVGGWQWKKPNHSGLRRVAGFSTANRQVPTAQPLPTSGRSRTAPVCDVSARFSTANRQLPTANSLPSGHESWNNVERRAFDYDFHKQMLDNIFYRPHI